MRLADLGRRFGNWLGIEPDDSDTVVNDGHRNLSRDAAALGPGVVLEHAPQGGAQIRSRLGATRATAPSPDFDNAITELRGLIFDLRSGLDQHREA